MRVSESKRILNMLGSSHIGSLWPKTSHALSLELITAIVKRAEQSAVRRDLGGLPCSRSMCFPVRREEGTRMIVQE